MPVKNFITRWLVIGALLSVVGAQDSPRGAIERPGADRSSSAPKELPRKDPRPDLPEPDLSIENLDFTLSKQVDEVNLIVSITDHKGRFVDNVTAEELKILDNHTSPAKLNYFQARTNLPLRVTFLIDVSSSVRDRLPFEQRAASLFLNHVLRKGTDQAAIISFASNVQDKTSILTRDFAALDTSIRSLRAYGETALYDAIIRASQKLQSHRSGMARPVIIVLSDGVDTASKQPLRMAEEAAMRCEAAIFALDSNSIYETDMKGRDVLDQLTRETGGFVLDARTNDDLKNSFGKIEKILRTQYALGYAPPGLEADGSFRAIEVMASRRGLIVHARKGYYAPKR